MKRKLVMVCVLTALSSTAMAAEQVQFSTSGYKAERAMLANNPRFAIEVKQKLIDVKKFAIGEADVNGDGTKELFVHDGNSYSCGSRGCATYIFQKQGTQYLPIMNVVAGDVMAVGDKSSGKAGYKDIYLMDGRGEAIRWSFDGKEYQFNN